MWSADGPTRRSVDPTSAARPTEPQGVLVRPTAPLTLSLNELNSHRMTMHLRHRVQSRLAYLWKIELTGAFVWSLLVGFWWERAKLGAASLIGLALVVWMLLQASFYWYLKLRAHRRRALMSDRTFTRWFKRLRIIDRLALVLAPAGIWWVMGTTITSHNDLVVGMGLWAVALLEYLNYFHWQLLYDSRTEIRRVLRRRRLKAASLARDLARGGL